MKKIRTIFNLIKNFILRKRKFLLSFTKEDGRWYVDMPYWGFKKSQLEMVSGANTMLDKMADGESEVNLVIEIPKDKNQQFDNWIRCDKVEQLGLRYGATYKTNQSDEFWICPVTLFVLGRYPEVMYIASMKFYKLINNIKNI